MNEAGNGFRLQAQRPGGIRQLQHGIASVAHEPRASLCQPPCIDLAGRCQRPHDVGEVVGPRVKL